jgi:hypothetical protein
LGTPQKRKNQDCYTKAATINIEAHQLTYCERPPNDTPKVANIKAVIPRNIPARRLQRAKVLPVMTVCL